MPEMEMETSTCLEVEPLRRDPSLEEGSLNQLIHHLDPSSMLVLVLLKLEGSCLAPLGLALDSRRMPALVMSRMACLASPHHPLPRLLSQTLPSPRLCPAPPTPGELHHPMPLRIQPPVPPHLGDLHQPPPLVAPVPAQPGDLHQPPPLVAPVLAQPGELLHSIQTQEATRELIATDIATTPSRADQLVKHQVCPTRFLQPTHTVPPQSPTTTSLLQLPARQVQTVLLKAQL